MKSKIWWMLGIGLLAVPALVAGLRWRAGRRHAPAFRTVQATRGDLQVTILATGTVQPQNRLELKPPIAGRVEEILVEEGQPVKQGQVLARMSSTERAVLLDAARAKGPEELTHWQELYKPTPLIAPIDGMVIVRSVEPGQSVAASDAVLVLSDRLVVMTQVDETDIGRIALNQPAHLTLDAYPDRGVDGRVDHIAYEAKTVSNVTIYEVEVLPAQVPSVMRSGMTANVTFVVAEKSDVLLLPADAVRQEQGKTTVLMRTSERGRPESKTIETGLSDGKRVEVVSGLADGDTVLVKILNLSRKGPAPSNPLSQMGRGGGGGRPSR